MYSCSSKHVECPLVAMGSDGTVFMGVTVAYIICMTFWFCFCHELVCAHVGLLALRCKLGLNHVAGPYVCQCTSIIKVDLFSKESLCWLRRRDGCRLVRSIFMWQDHVS